MSADLTPRQREVLRAIIGHVRAHQRPPTVRELGAAIGVTSPNCVAGHLRALRKKGAISVDRKVARGIRVEVRP